MNRHLADRPAVPRLEFLGVRNYRALRDLELKPLTPLTVLVGPNGSGKSTILDVFAFLAECFTEGLRRAWDRRGRFKELRTRGQEGPIEIELKYREEPGSPIITYHLAIDENQRGPIVAEEWLRWKRGRHGQPFRFLHFEQGEGQVVTGEMPDEKDAREQERLATPDVLAVSALGQFARHPRLSALRRFIAGWHLSCLSADSTRGQPEAGPQEHLSPKGDNLPNVIQYLEEQRPDILAKILRKVAEWVPRLQSVAADVLPDGRLLLQLKDAPFERPIPARFASDGTLKLLAYLTLLCDPNPPGLIGLKEPETCVHPRLLYEWTEECRKATGHTQLLVTTHSPFFVDALRPEELWVLYRDEQGFTQARRVADMVRVMAFLEEGALLGHLWTEGHFEVGDPLTSAGGPRPGAPQARRRTARGGHTHAPGVPR